MQIWNQLFLFTEHELAKDYRNDPVIANLCRMFTCLAFVPPSDVKDVFNELVNSKYYDKKIDSFAAYFEVNICQWFLKD